MVGGGDAAKVTPTSHHHARERVTGDGRDERVCTVKLTSMFIRVSPLLILILVARGGGRVDAGVDMPLGWQIGGVVGQENPGLPLSLWTERGDPGLEFRGRRERGSCAALLSPEGIGKLRLCSNLAVTFSCK